MSQSKTVSVRWSRGWMPIAFVAMLVMTAAHDASAQVVVRGRTVHTMAGAALSDGVVVIENGVITAVGPAGQVPIPDGAEILDAVVVTPGLIDAHSVVGLAGQYNYDHDQDQLEHSAPIQPELRAIDAYNADERLIEWIRSFGVTTVHTGHAPGELISGQTMIVKTTGHTVNEALVEPVSMVAATLAESAQKSEGDGSPGTRSKMMAMLRAQLVKANAYRKKRPDDRANGDDDADPPARDLGLEALARVLDGELPLLVTAQRAQDIANALRLAREFDIRLVLDGAAESFRLLDEIQRAGVPVIIHPTMMRAYDETEHMSFETASSLVAAGIPVALQSGYESYVPKTRVVLFEAALAAANGLTFEQALATITVDAARILGIDDRVGTIEVGKHGDLALYDGDPFEYTSHCIGTLIQGRVVSRERR